MNFLKKIFSRSTGYWIHRVSTLPVGADIFIDIHKRIRYGSLNIVFDVGANIGQTQEWIRNNEPAATIYCFEPVKATFSTLQDRTAKDPNTIRENIAFGEVPGEKLIRLYDQYSVLNSLKDEVMNRDAGANEETIRVDTIDRYCASNQISKIDFLKIDTEGYELNVLEGAAKLLDAGAISFIYCETGFQKTNKRNTYFADLNEWLAAKNYYFFGLYQLSSDAWKAGDYFGNALYIHKDVFNP